MHFFDALQKVLGLKRDVCALKIGGKMIVFIT